MKRQQGIRIRYTKICRARATATVHAINTCTRGLGWRQTVKAPPPETAKGNLLAASLAACSQEQGKGSGTDGTEINEQNKSGFPSKTPRPGRDGDQVTSCFVHTDAAKSCSSSTHPRASRPLSQQPQDQLASQGKHVAAAPCKLARRRESGERVAAPSVLWLHQRAGAKIIARCMRSDRRERGALPPPASPRAAADARAHRQATGCPRGCSCGAFSSVRVT